MKRNTGPIIHGIQGYWRSCRCSLCKAGYSEYNRKFYQAKKAKELGLDDEVIENEVIEFKPIPIRPYQKQLVFIDFPKSDSFFEVLKGLGRQGKKAIRRTA